MPRATEIHSQRSVMRIVVVAGNANGGRLSSKLEMFRRHDGIMHSQLLSSATVCDTTWIIHGEGVFEEFSCKKGTPVLVSQSCERPPVKLFHGYVCNSYGRGISCKVIAVQPGLRYSSPAYRVVRTHVAAQTDDASPSPV